MLLSGLDVDEPKDKPKAKQKGKSKRKGEKGHGATTTVMSVSSSSKATTPVNRPSMVGFDSKVRGSTKPVEPKGRATSKAPTRK